MRSSDPNSIFRDIERSLEREINDIIQDINNDIENATPVRSGRAQRGWRGPGRYRLGSDVIVAENTVPYIGLLEMGYSKQAPNGMIEPAMRKLNRRNRKL